MESPIHWQLMIYCGLNDAVIQCIIDTYLIVIQCIIDTYLIVPVPIYTYMNLLFVPICCNAHEYPCHLGISSNMSVAM